MPFTILNIPKDGLTEVVGEFVTEAEAARTTSRPEFSELLSDKLTDLFLQTSALNEKAEKQRALAEKEPRGPQPDAQIDQCFRGTQCDVAAKDRYWNRDEGDLPAEVIPEGRSQNCPGQRHQTDRGDDGRARTGNVDVMRAEDSPDESGGEIRRRMNDRSEYRQGGEHDQKYDPQN